jgi:hypothetical protein
MDRMPVLNGALLCDAARDYNGLVFILGGFVNVLQVTELPIPAPVSYAARVSFASDEPGPHRAIVQVKGPDGTILGTVIGETEALPTQGGRVEIPELGNGLNMVFPMPFPVLVEGMHWVELEVDGVSLSSLPLMVVRVPKQP